MCDAKFARLFKMIWNSRSKNLHCTLHTGSRCDRGSRRAAKICIIEVCKAIGSSSNFTTHATFFPRQDALMCAKSSEQISDCIAISNYNAIDTTNFAGFSGDI
jgi:hypothetical protein